MRGIVQAFVCLGLATSSSATAWADDVATAERLFQEALDAGDAGDWATACPKFRASHAAAPSVGALLNMASCSARDGQLLRAKEEYLSALRLNASTQDPVRKEAVRARAEQEIAALDARIPRLRVSASPATARLRVSVDGQPVDLADAGLALDPGPHALRIEADGFETVSRQVHAQERQPLEVDVALTPIAVTPPPPVWPDAAAADAPPTDTESNLLWIGGIVGAAGLVIAALSAVPLVAASKRAEEIRALCGADARPPSCTEGSAEDAQRATALSDEGEPLAIAGYALIGVGGAALATGIALMVAGASAGAPSTASGFVPLVGPREVGLCFQAAF